MFLATFLGGFIASLSGHTDCMQSIVNKLSNLLYVPNCVKPRGYVTTVILWEFLSEENKLGCMCFKNNILILEEKFL
jgi:hypothetical protein